MTHVKKYLKFTKILLISVGIIFCLHTAQTFETETGTVAQCDPLLVIVIMVKNEAPVIQATLQPYVDAGLNAYFVFDTGSTDNTMALAQELFETHHVNHGVIKQELFIDFATSRNRALELAQEAFPNACFMLMLDAEWYIHDVPCLINFCQTHINDKNTSYLVRITDNQLDFYTPRLIRCHSHVAFVGAVHEVLNQVTYTKVPANCFFELRTTRYGQEKTAQRWHRDCDLLLKEYNKNPYDPRTVFYLAQTYACLGDLEKAQHWYEKRITMPGWDKENFMAWYRLAQVYEALDKKDEAVCSYLKAYSLRPHRAEPLIRLAQHYWKTGDNALCFLFASRALAIPYPEQDVLFVDKDLYDYTRYDLVGRSAWYVGEYAIGQTALLCALKVKPNEEYLKKNLGYYTQYTQTSPHVCPCI
jgi:tetratricopeptide (TPR) repeat protein